MRCTILTQEIGAEYTSKVAEGLRKTGMKITKVVNEMGVILGEVEMESTLEAVRQVPGVQEVEVERQTAPIDPEAPVQ